MTDYILIEKIWQDIFCYQVKITCASSHVVATNDIYISDDSIDTLFNGLNDFIKGKTKDFFWENGKKGDIIVLAGKGHEDYQEINGVKYPMDERVLIQEILKEMKESV